MSLEQETLKLLEAQIKEEQEQLKNQKKALRAKKLMAVALRVKANQSPLQIPNKFWNTLKVNIIKPLVKIYDTAILNVDMPLSAAIKKLLAKAELLSKKAIYVNHDTKEAKLYSIKCADMVIRLETAAQISGIGSTNRIELEDMAKCLDAQVQRLRTTKPNYIE